VGLGEPGHIVLFGLQWKTPVSPEDVNVTSVCRFFLSTDANSLPCCIIIIIRGLGTHISFVRSVTMDSWTDKQLALMKAGGNQNCKEFLSKHGIDFRTTSIKERYDCPPAELYRQILKARVEGRPEPTELPQPVKRSEEQEKAWANRPMQGFGSGIHPREEQRRQRRNVAIGVGIGSAVAFAAGVLLKKK
jgi:ADP-ribosylation factor GTPase-activating protein 1